MPDRFMLHPLPNTLAVVVLLALIVSWLTSLVMVLKNEPIEFEKGWYPKLTLAFSLLSVPALFDLLQASGIALVFSMIASLAITVNIVVLVLRLSEKSSHPLVRDWFKWSIPVLAIGGLAVAAYFVFLEFTGGTVACGPVQGCDTVQNSQYATLFGIVPMGVFGFAGYIAILGGWSLWQYGPASMRKPGSLSMWGFCVFGVLFSIYLTFLEPFVIGATCMWCITSAVFMMILLLFTTPAAHQALTVSEEAEFLPGRA
jgi:uncharacterized membrane protein